MKRCLNLATWVVLAFLSFAVQVGYAEQQPVRPSVPVVTTVRTLVPYADLNKVLAEQVGKYVILPLAEYERMVEAKDRWLSSQSTDLEVSPPLSHRFESLTLEGRIDGDFAHLEAEFSFETLTEGWQTLELMRGVAAIASVTLDDRPSSLVPTQRMGEARSILFGRRLRPGALAMGSGYQDVLRQDNWAETVYALHVHGLGRHHCRVSMIIPVERQDERFTLALGLVPIPLSSIRLAVADHVLAIEECSLRDFTVEEPVDPEVLGCGFFGYLGAGGDLKLVWRKKVRRKLEPIVPTPMAPDQEPAMASGTMQTASAAMPVPKPRPVVAPPKPTAKPLIYARSETLITLGEGALQGRVDVEYAISKAPVSRFEVMLPDTIELLSVSADRPETHEVRREGQAKRLIVDFTASREDRAQISLTYEARMDDTQGSYTLPEVSPQGVARELGAIAVQAFSSVEVQPSEAWEKAPGRRVFRIDPAELPEQLRKRAARPILLAYRHSARPIELPIVVKRYADLPQQTVVADTMDAKTTFTTNRSSNTQISLRIRNNNKQYLTFQLASEAEVLTATIDGKPVKPVTDRAGGKVLIPLQMSRVLGRSEEMDLRLLYKQAIATMSWRGELDFAVPIVDIPVSRCVWTLFAPVQYTLFGFQGSVTPSRPVRDPFFFRGFLRAYDVFWMVLEEPATLALLFFVGFGALMVLSRELVTRILGAFWSGTVAVVRYVFTGAMFRLGEIIVVITLVAILGAISIPNFRKAREQARGKACYANQRVLLGAVEMYNMDHSVLITDFHEGRIEELRKGQYLKSQITKPELQCAYSSVGNLTQDGYLTCRLHGPVEERESDSRYAAGMAANEGYAQKSRDASDMALPPGMPSSQAVGAIAGKPSLGGRAKGVHAVENRLVLTPNFFSLERDLILPDIASDGRVLANRTRPTVALNYLRAEVLVILRIVGFFGGLLMGMYFITGSVFSYQPKLIAAAVILAVLSAADLSIDEIGDFANLGLWISLAIGFLWKIGSLVAPYLGTMGGSGDDVPPSDGPGGTSGRKNSSRPTSKTWKADPLDDGLEPPKPEPADPDSAESGDTVKPAEPAPGAASRIGVSGAVAVLVLLTLLLSGTAFAGPAGREHEVRVLVPFADLSKVVETSDKVVILPADDYQYLRNLGIPVPPVPERAPEDVVIRSASYIGRVEERGVRFQAVFRFDLPNPAWKRVRLLAGEVVPFQAKLDGQPTALDLIPGENGVPAQFGLITQASGSHEIELGFFVPLKGRDPIVRRFELPMVPVCQSSLEVETGDPESDGWIDPGVLTVKSTASGTRFTALLPPTRLVRFEWFRRVTRPVAEPAPITPEQPTAEASAAAVVATATATASGTRPDILKEETRVFVQETRVLSFEEGFVRGRNRYQLEVTGGEGIASFSFLVPPRITLLKVEGRSVEDWRTDDPQPGQTMKRLHVAFSSRLKGQTELLLEFEEDTQELKDNKYEVPEVIPLQVDRVVGMLGLGCLQVLELKIEDAMEGYNPINVTEFPAGYGLPQPERMPFAFKYIRSPKKIVVTVTRPEDVEVQTALIDKAEAMTVLSEDGYLLTRVAYELRNNAEQFLKMRLPGVGSSAAELWSSEVAGQPVKAGFDREHGLFNVPIIRSPQVNGEAQSFPVEIVFAVRLSEPVRPMMSLGLQLPWVHLEISDLSWVVYLPEGYELMRGRGNVDFSMAKPTQGLLDGSRSFAIKNQLLAGAQATAQSGFSGGSSENQRLFGLLGLLPVKFNLPVTSYWTAYTMQQIEPKNDPPHLESVLLTPRKGSGRILSWLMVLLGMVAGVAALCVLTNRRPLMALLVIAVLGSLLAVALLMKLYQADTSFKMGFLAMAISGALHLLFRWKPDKS